MAENAQDLSQILVQSTQAAEENAQAAVQTLDGLASVYSPEALFTACFTRLLVARGEASSEVTHGDVPAKLEQLVYHLWRCRTPGISEPTTVAVQTAVEAVDQLSRGLLLATTLQASSVSGEALGLDRLLASIQVDVQVIRGSAYPEQISEQIMEIAGPFDNWFARRIGATASDLVAAVWAVAWGTLNKVNQWLASIQGEVPQRGFPPTRTTRRKPSGRTPRDSHGAEGVQFLENLVRGAHSAVPLAREEAIVSDDSAVGESTWNALLAMIGFKREHGLAAEDFLVARARPLFTLSDGRVLLGNPTSALDRLWEALDSTAKGDADFYDTFQDRKSRWLEAKTSEHLRRVFGENQVYHSVTYPDPDRQAEKATAEIDAVVHWDPFLVLVEAKAKQFRLEGQLGDIAKLRSDLRANLEDAFHQAKRARRYLDSQDQVEFIEKGTGRRLQVRRQDLRRIYIVTVSLFYLGSAINRLAKLQNLKLFDTNEYPWAVSRADLDIITKFCEGPDVFLHYLERRQEIEQQPTGFPINDDLDFFAAYLKMRLHPSALPGGGKGKHFVWLAGWQARFDEWMEHMRGLRPDPPTIRLEVPDQVRGVLEELRQRRDDADARWIAFSLLGLSNQELGTVAAALEDARRQQPAPGMYRRIAITIGELALSVTVMKDRPTEELRSRTLRRAMAEKYRRRVSRSIGFGLLLEEHEKAFDCCVWIESPWAPDPEMERLLDHEPPFVPAPGQEVPGRNDPCVCGSGRKFKKCCLRRIGVFRVNHW